MADNWCLRDNENDRRKRNEKKKNKKNQQNKDRKEERGDASYSERVKGES